METCNRTKKRGHEKYKSRARQKLKKFGRGFCQKRVRIFFDYGVRENGKHLRTKNRINQRPTSPSAKTKGTKEKYRVVPCPCLSLAKNRDRSLCQNSSPPFGQKS